jgi:hypothetical protein
VIKSLTKNDFVKQVMLLVSGATIGQAISFFASLATSRLFSPEDFGILGFYLSAVGISSVFANGKYDLGIVILKDNGVVRSLVRLCLVLLLFFCILLTLLGILAFMFSDGLGISQEKIQWLPFLGLGVFLSGYANVMYMFFTRLKRFGVLSLSRILESIGLNGLAIVFWFVGSSGLLIGFLASQVLSIVYYEYRIRKLSKDTECSEKSSVGLGDLIQLAKELINYPKYNIFLSFMDMLQTQVFFLLGSIWFQTAVLGWYSFSMRILQVPLYLIVKPLSNVFLAKAADHFKNQQTLLPLVRKTIFSTFLLALPLFLILFFLGPLLFAFLFGEAWKPAGIICSILSFWMIIDLVRVPISQIPVILGRQKEMVGWTTLGTLITILSIAYAGLYHPKDIYMAFSIITLGQSCFALMIIFVTYKQAITHDRNIA